MLVYITRPIPNSATTLLEQAGCEVVMEASEEVPTQEQLIDRVSKRPYDVIVPLLTDHINAQIFDACPSIKMVACFTSGFDHVDIDEATKRNIVVTHSTGDFSRSVAEHAVTLMCSLAKHIVGADTFVKNGMYKGWTPSLFVGKDLYGLTLGILGAGHIGSHVARIAHNGFGMKIIYSDIKRNLQFESEYDAQFCENIDELCMISDVITLHAPLTNSTRHLINERRIRLMKPDAYLINTSRGALVDERALTGALTTRTIAGAALDVFENEPEITPGLAELPNVILTPHIASATFAARDEMACSTVKSIIAFKEGKEIQDIVIR